MDPFLLKAIHEVENKYGSLDNPKADLSKVHKIVKQLGLYGNEHTRVKTIWYSYQYCCFMTNSRKLVKAYHLRYQGLTINAIRQKVHLSNYEIQRVRKIININESLQLAPRNERYRVGMATC